MLTKSFPYNPSQRDSLNVVAQFLKILLQREISRILKNGGLFKALSQT